MSGGLQRVSVAEVLEEAQKVRPSEIVLGSNGEQSVISWEGTPVSTLWLTGYVDRLIAAGLVRPADSTAGLAGEALALVEHGNDERLHAWHRALGGLPKELLEAARVHFEKNGLPAEWRRGHLKPSDVSRWVRARAVRHVPAHLACPAHPGQREATCSECGRKRRESISPERIREIRATLGGMTR